MSPRFPSRFRLRLKFAAASILLCVAARGAIPSGFMPDPESTGHPHIRLVMCTSGGAHIAGYIVLKKAVGPTVAAVHQYAASHDCAFSHVTAGSSLDGAILSSWLVAFPLVHSSSQGISAVLSPSSPLGARAPPRPLA